MFIAWRKVDKGRKATSGSNRDQEKSMSGVRMKKEFSRVRE